MSVEAVKWAMFDAPMLVTDKGNPDSTARQVLAVLAEHATEHGRNARPSVLRIRYATGLDERTIQRALLRLERGGLTSRDGVDPSGVVRWRLHMDRVRPDGDLAALRAEAEEVRRVESERRKARRHRNAGSASGTQNTGRSGTESPGQARVSGTESPGYPGRRIPASGTQNPDVRDAESPEPPVEPPLNHQKEPTSLSPPEPHPVSAAAEDRERDGMDQEPENPFQRLLRIEAGITDRTRADHLIHGASQLPGGDKGLGWWKKIIRAGDLDDVAAEIDAVTVPAIVEETPARADAHPFVDDGTRAARCSYPEANARHRVAPLGPMDPAVQDRRFAARQRNGRRYEPFRNPEPADYDQPL